MKSDMIAIERPHLTAERSGEPGHTRLAARIELRVSAARQIWIIALKEFGDRFRSGWVIACVLVWLGAIGLTSFLGLLQIGRMGMQGYERTVVSLLNLAQYLVPLLGLLLGHDVMVSEGEERTMRLLLAGGVTRGRILLGKFVGGSFSLAVPLLSGFLIAGAAIGLTTHDHSIASFLRLAVSGLVLGIVFLAIGLTVSTFSRTRVQSLVLALLSWCLAVFVFDLVALGCVVSAKSPVAANEIEVICDATHVNAAADIHSQFDNLSETNPRIVAQHRPSSLGWLALNPVDLFRSVNLAAQLGFEVPLSTILVALTLWLVSTLGASFWRLSRIDL